MTERDYPLIVTARLKAHLGPMDRGEWYEDPLSAVLERGNHGRVIGGGSQLGSDSKIEFADLEIALADLHHALAVTRETLEGLGVPLGSELLYEANGALKSVPIGTLSVLCLYLDGVGLPDEVYSGADFDGIVSDITAALLESGSGHYRGFWQGETETCLYVFGQELESVYSTLEPVFERHPLFQNARIVFEHRSPVRADREIRMPMR